MTSIVQRISTDQLIARFEGPKEKAVLLTTLLGEVQIIGINNSKRPTTDAEAIPVIKKFVKNAEENAQHWNHRNFASQEKRQVFLKEIEILQSYLPSQMTESMISDAIANYKMHDNPSANKGQLMAYLKTNFTGQYDGKTAATVIDSLLSSEVS